MSCRSRMLRASRSTRVTACLLAEKVEQNLEFAPATASRAACLFGADHVAAGRLQRASLQVTIAIILFTRTREVLVDRFDTRA
jgi:hypothetical protein